MNILILPIEPIENRYTSQWYTSLPEQLQRHFTKANVISLPGDSVPKPPLNGAFLNFEGTSHWKTSQFLNLLSLWSDLNDNDLVIFPDAWNPLVLQLRYMADLTKKKLCIYGLWHAGAYDQNDFLGRGTNKEWVVNAEQAMFQAYDKNFFATRFSELLFTSSREVNESKARIVGWPMEYLDFVLAKVQTKSKRRQVAFPHRLSVEKNYEGAKLLAKVLLQDYDINTVFCQEEEMNKCAYYECLAASSVVLSMSYQETLGISMYEGAKLGATPVAPSDLSYLEMLPKQLLYPASWRDTNGMEGEDNVKQLASFVAKLVDSPVEEDSYLTKLEPFFNGSNFYKELEN